MIKKERQDTISKIWFIPLVIVVVIVPLIVLAHKYKNGLENYVWFGNVEDSYDIYLYYKALVLKTCGAIVAVMCIGLYVRNKPTFLYNKKSYAPMLALVVYSVLTIISSVLAAVPWDASFGGESRFEGCYVILSYVFFFYMVFGYARSIKLIRFLLDALLIGAFFLGLIGVIEAFGVNIYEWDWLQSLLVVLEPNPMHLVYDETYVVTATLENPNYVGSYVALVGPYCVYLLLRGEKLWRRILAGITFELLGIFLFGSESDTGLIAVAAGLVVAVFFILPDLNKKIRVVIVTVGGVAVVLIVSVLLTGDFSKYFFVAKELPIIENMETDYNSVIITTSDKKRIRVTMDDSIAEKDGWSKGNNPADIINVTDEDNGKKLRVTKAANNKGILVDVGYPEFTFYTGNVMIETKEKGKEIDKSVLDVLRIDDGKNSFNFSTFMGANMCYLYLDSAERVLLRNVDRTGFEGMYGFANGRGYIWACTIPLLKDYLFLGAGQDNFIYAFPNDDYIGKRISGFDGYYISKPHNMFLGFWVQQGFIALLAFLFLYGLFMIRAIRLCYGKHKIPSSSGFSAKGVVITTAVGTSAYMVAGLANDTVVGVHHLYWILLGVGYAAEAICRRKPSEEKPVLTEEIQKEGFDGERSDKDYSMS